MPVTYTMINPNGKECSVDIDQIKLLKAKGWKDIKNEEKIKEVDENILSLAEAEKDFNNKVDIYKAIENKESDEAKSAHEEAKTAKVVLDKLMEN